MTAGDKLFLAYKFASRRRTADTFSDTWLMNCRNEQYLLHHIRMMELEYVPPECFVVDKVAVNRCIFFQKLMRAQPQPIAITLEMH